jgi:hypothetical protein
MNTDFLFVALGANRSTGPRLGIAAASGSQLAPRRPMATDPNTPPASVSSEWPLLAHATDYNIYYASWLIIGD